MKEREKSFFFVNKKEAKKTFIIWSVVKPPMLQIKRSFCAAPRVGLFSKSAAFL
jgi:hypothetical protein